MFSLKKTLLLSIRYLPFIASICIALSISGCKKPEPETQNQEIVKLRQAINTSFNKIQKPDYNGVAIRANNIEIQKLFEKEKDNTNQLTTLFSREMAKSSEYSPSDYTVTIQNISIKQPLSKTRLNHVRVTFNRMGFGIAISEQVKQKPFYLELFNLSNQTILDVGAGWGDITLHLLQKNNKVLCNELEAAQLLGIYELADRQSLAKNLYLSNAKFPQDFKPIKDNTFDSIVLHRILAVLTPDQAEKSIQAAYRMLKPHGKLYLTSLSDQHHLYQANIAKFPEKILFNKNGMLQFLAKEGLPLQAYILPETVTAISEQPFINYLHNIGFQVVHTEYPGTTQQTGVPEEKQLRKGKENIAIIAIKTQNK